ncbi:hypothetical protein [Marinobacter sp.]|uniref:hypothetical protein n=1 Tax=Pseudomonadota TaxID=1224 RepID=UPI003A8EBD8C
MNAIRTTHKTYEFSHPFSLIGYAQSFLPGRYSIEIEEEVPSGSGVLDFSRVKSRLYFTPQFGAPVEIGFFGVDPDDFDRAAFQDEGRHFRDYNTMDSIAEMPRFDRLAIERAENEGMIVK